MKIKLFFLLLYLLMSQPLFAQQNSGGASDLDTPNYVTVFNIDAIGGEQVEIYKNNSNQYFYNPLLLVDWVDFKKKLDSFNDKNDLTEIKILLKINHFDSKVYSELMMLLEREATNNKINLSSLPYTYYILRARIGNEYIIINPTDLPTFSSIGNFQVKHLINVVRKYEISGSLKQLREFYKFRGSNDNLKGSLYMGGFEFSSDYVKATANFANNVKLQKKLFGDENLKISQEVRTTNTGNGLVLNLGFLKFGNQGGKTVVRATQDKKRIVNRTYLSDFITNNQTDIQISAQGDPDRIRETKNQMVNFILEKVATQVSLEFQKMSDDEYNLVKDNIAYATLTRNEVESLLSSKPRLELDTKDKTEVAVGDKKLNKENEYSLKTNDDITWKRAGNEFIPSKIDMYILSENQFSNSILMESFVINKEGKKTIEIPFIYPAAWLEEHPQNVVVDKVNPIGSILAFAGNRDKIPAGWRLCDGKELPIKGNEELFNVIAYLWGRGLNGNFKIPDLRGVFLRGVDYGKGLDIDRNYHRVDTVVGHYEEDAYVRHTHDIENTNSATRRKERVDNNDNKGAIVNGDENSNAPLAIKLSGGSETRPKNYTVNYIIRCN